MAFRPSGISVSIRQDLTEGSGRSGTTLNIDPIITKDGRRVTMADIGDIGFAKLDQGTDSEEIISFTGITDNTSTYQLTGCVWGYNFYDTTNGVSANQKRHISGGTFIITNDDHFLSTQYINADDDQTVAGVKTFSSFPVTPSSAPTTDYQTANKKYADDLAIAGAPDMDLTTKGIGEEATASEINAGTQTGGTGAELIVNPKYLKDSEYFTFRPTTDEKDALVGTSGTASTTNKYVTDEDTAETATASKVVRADSNNKIDSDYITFPQDVTATAGEDLLQNDAIYPSGASEISRVKPIAVGAGVTSTNSGTTQYKRVHTIGDDKILVYGGGSDATTAVSASTIQLGTLDADEQDITYAGSQDFEGGDGSRDHDSVLLSETKSVVIWQDTSAGVANGIKMRVHTRSGSTITQGSITTIETTGDNSAQVSIAKLDTDKVLVSYVADSDGNLYTAVYTISGTTLTGFTPVQVAVAASSNVGVRMDGVDTDTVVIAYTTPSDYDVDAAVITVSGTTPSIGTPISILDDTQKNRITVRKIDTTRAVISVQDTSVWTIRMYVATISGTDLSKGSVASITTYNHNQFGTPGLATIGTKNLLVSYKTSDTVIATKLYTINTSSFTALDTVTDTTSASNNSASFVAKIAPWKYLVQGAKDTSPWIYSLSDNGIGGDVGVNDNPLQVGIAKADIASAASGTYRLRKGILDGYTGLTAGTLYYIDDDSQPTTDSSLISPTYGVAISATEMYLE